MLSRKRDKLSLQEIQTLVQDGAKIVSIKDKGLFILLISEALLKKVNALGISLEKFIASLHNRDQ